MALRLVEVGARREGLDPVHDDVDEERIGLRDRRSAPRGALVEDAGENDEVERLA
jgi:hypothetical protein